MNEKNMCQQSHAMDNKILFSHVFALLKSVRTCHNCQPTALDKVKQIFQFTFFSPLFVFVEKHFLYCLLFECYNVLVTFTVGNCFSIAVQIWEGTRSE